MINKMMNTMIRSMSVEEREEMMLQMMPEMMKRVDAKILVPDIIATLGKMITQHGIYKTIDKLQKDQEAFNLLKDRLSKLKIGAMSKMSYMMGIMMPFMQNIMPKIMGFMMPMMSGMCMDLKRTGSCDMFDILDHSQEMKTNMGDMMFEMCPQMAGKVIPKEKSAEFIEKMTEAVFNI